MVSPILRYTSYYILAHTHSPDAPPHTKSRKVFFFRKFTADVYRWRWPNPSNVSLSLPLCKVFEHLFFMVSSLICSWSSWIYCRYRTKFAGQIKHGWAYVLLWHPFNNHSYPITQEKWSLQHTGSPTLHYVNTRGFTWLPYPNQTSVSQIIADQHTPIDTLFYHFRNQTLTQASAVCFPWETNSQHWFIMILIWLFSYATWVT